jgi:hypothetical protein
MPSLALEEVDLAHLASLLRRRYGRHLYTSYLRGRTLLRDGVREQLVCSSYQAEELIETLELHGYLRFPHLADETHPLTRHAWIIDEQGSAIAHDR